MEKFRPNERQRAGQSPAAHRQTFCKGVQLLISLLFKCLKEHDAELIIAGKDEMFMPALLKLQGSLCENVKVLGFVPDANLPELYNYADIFLMPSLTMESFGIAAIESLACATPVIATKAGT